MKVFITGSSSFFTKLFVKYVKNIEIVYISSKTNRNSSNMIFDLNFLDEFEEDSFIVHSAWNMSERTESKSRIINLEGSLSFFNSLNSQQKKRFIFVSTNVASEDAVSVYGQHKYEVEQEILKKGGLVMKCALLIDEERPFEEGFFSDLYKLASKAPVVPNFSSRNKIYQLTRGPLVNDRFNELIELNYNMSRTLDCFDNNLYSFNELVKNVMGLEKPIVNIPWTIGYYTSRMFEIFHFKFPIKSDSLLGIKESKVKRDI